MTLYPTPAVTNICLVVVINAIEPPSLFQYVNSPAVCRCGLSNLVNSQVIVTNKLNLQTFRNSCASNFVKIRLGS